MLANSLQEIVFSEEGEKEPQLICKPLNSPPDNRELPVYNFQTYPLFKVLFCISHSNTVLSQLFTEQHCFCSEAIVAN